MGFPGGSRVKNLPAMQETRIRFLGQEDPLEEGTATHSSTLAQRIPMDRGPWKAAVHRVATESDRTEATKQQQQEEEYIKLLQGTQVHLWLIHVDVDREQQNSVKQLSFN